MEFFRNCQHALVTKQMIRFHNNKGLRVTYQYRLLSGGQHSEFQHSINKVQYNAFIRIMDARWIKCQKLTFSRLNASALRTSQWPARQHGYVLSTPWCLTNQCTRKRKDDLAATSRVTLRRRTILPAAHPRQIPPCRRDDRKMPVFLLHLCPLVLRTAGFP